jgi:hypothetical protein
MMAERRETVGLANGGDAVKTASVWPPMPVGIAQTERSRRWPPAWRGGPIVGGPTLKATHPPWYCGFSGLEHFERPFIRCGFYQDRPPLRVIRQFSINKKRVTIRNNARNTSFCNLVDIVVVRQTFNF